MALRALVLIGLAGVAQATLLGNLGGAPLGAPVSYVGGGLGFGAQGIIFATPDITASGVLFAPDLLTYQGVGVQFGNPALALACRGIGTGAASGALNRSRLGRYDTLASGQAAIALVRARPASGDASASSTQAEPNLRRGRGLACAGTAAGGQACTPHALHPLAAPGVAAGVQAAGLRRLRGLYGAASALASQRASLEGFSQGVLSGAGFAVSSSPPAVVLRLRGMAPAGTAGTTQAAALHARRPLLAVAGTAAGVPVAAVGRSRPLAPAGVATSVGQAQLTRLRALAANAAAASESALLGTARLRGILQSTGTAAGVQWCPLTITRAMRAPGLAQGGQEAELGRAKSLAACAGRAEAKARLALQAGRGLVCPGLALSRARAGLFMPYDGHRHGLAGPGRTATIRLDTRTALVRQGGGP